MSSIPAAMRRNDRPTIPHFDPREFLYRRVPLSLWDNAAVPLEINAVSLPDLSVGRSRFGHPEWLRIEMIIEEDDRKHLERYDDYGVIGFRVQDVPTERFVNGVVHYTFRVHHDPGEYNYPHSEVRCYEDGIHVDAFKKLPEEMHLTWRELLLRKIEVFLKPHQPAAIRQTAPTSHIPELPIPIAV
jgi:hypothetical protein